MKILIIGGGGREHAIAWKLHRESHALFAAPGNPGIAEYATCVPLPLDDHQALIGFVKMYDIQLTIVGPEAPLAAGIVDAFENEGRWICGPSQDAARLESDKSFCCTTLRRSGVPIPFTNGYNNFQELQHAVRDIEQGIVLKYCGLAAGKGVEVVRSPADLPVALARLSRLPDGPYLTQALEEGPELSFFVVTDSRDHLFVGSAQDYKPLYPNGPNTGGMGGFSPHPILTPDLRNEIETSIVGPTIRHMRSMHIPYRGVMYFQLMITKRGPVVIEINCRFGDPEAQLILPFLDYPLGYLLFATTQDGLLRSMKGITSRSLVSVGITMASEGYPEDDPIVGRRIQGLESDTVSTLVFHSGTKMDKGALVTAGGRVLTVVGVGVTYATAKHAAMTRVGAIRFEGAQHRTDIADDIITAEP